MHGIVYPGPVFLSFV